MDKNITVENLVDLFDADKTANKESFFSQLKVENYIPYEQKIAIAEAIFNAGLEVNEEKSRINSPQRYFFYCLGILNAYTNIAVSLASKEDDNPAVFALQMCAEFNALNSRGLFELIFSKIPEKELEEFNTIIDMVTNDYFENNFAFHGYMDNLLNSITKLISLLPELYSSDSENEEQNE